MGNVLGSSVFDDVSFTSNSSLKTPTQLYGSEIISYGINFFKRRVVVFNATMTSQILLLWQSK